MTTDRELLELAAKAAGMLVLPEGEPWPAEKVGWFFNQVGDNPPALYDRASHVLQKWAPLTDDGDALRLASDLKLGISYHHANNNPAVTVYVAMEWHKKFSEFHELISSDCLAATRRAIVRAAAEIGRAM